MLTDSEVTDIKEAMAYGLICKKAMAYDLICMIESNAEKQNYSPREIKEIINAYIKAYIAELAQE